MRQVLPGTPRRMEQAGWFPVVAMPKEGQAHQHGRILFLFVPFVGYTLVALAVAIGVLTLLLHASPW